MPRFRRSITLAAIALGVWALAPAQALVPILTGVIVQTTELVECDAGQCEGPTSPEWTNGDCDGTLTTPCKVDPNYRCSISRVPSPQFRVEECGVAPEVCEAQVGAGKCWLGALVDQWDEEDVFGVFMPSPTGHGEMYEFSVAARPGFPWPIRMCVYPPLARVGECTQTSATTGVAGVLALPAQGGVWKIVIDCGRCLLTEAAADSGAEPAASSGGLHLLPGTASAFCPQCARQTALAGCYAFGAADVPGTG